MCYLDHSLPAGDDMLELDYSLHNILFPNIEPEYKEFCRAENFDTEALHPKWRNAKIDVQMLWCHIYHTKDIFVSRDRNFERKKDELNNQIGKIEIMNPIQFLRHIREPDD